MSEEMNSRIKKIVCEVLELDASQLDDETPFQELGFDSMQSIEILASLEVHLGITLDQEELPTMNNLAGVYAVVAEELERA